MKQLQIFFQKKNYFKNLLTSIAVNETIHFKYVIFIFFKSEYLIYYYFNINTFIYKQIKKCNDITCTVCKTIRLSQHIFATLDFLPDLTPSTGTDILFYFIIQTNFY